MYGALHEYHNLLLKGGFLEGSSLESRKWVLKVLKISDEDEEEAVDGEVFSGRRCEMTHLPLVVEYRSRT